jgi:hypothetical protein
MLRNLNRPFPGTNRHILGTPYVGVLGSDVPLTGDDGAPFLANDSLDPNKRYRAEMVTWPAAGTLTVFEDSSFTFVGAPDGTYYATYNHVEDDVIVGSPVNVTFIVGPATTVVVIQALEYETALPITLVKRVPVDQAVEVETAQVARIAKLIPVDQAVETETAQTVNAGTLTLNALDLHAISEAVRLMLVDQGCFTKIDEIWTRLGLNPAAPLTNHTDGGITATGIDIEASSDGDNIVQTRQ